MKIPDAIQSERVVIRPFREEDLAAYLRFMTDPDATQYLLLELEQKTKTGAQISNTISANFPLDNAFFLSEGIFKTLFRLRETSNYH